MSVDLVIATGWRDWPYPEVVHHALDDIYLTSNTFSTLFHGACTRKGSDELIGADRHADDWGHLARDILVKPFQADWDLHDDAAGPIRNAAMVESALKATQPSRIVGVAFPGPGSRGTLNCMRLMKDAGIHVETWDIKRAREWMEGYGRGA